MIVKSTSTGKPKDKRSQLIRMTECSTCPKLLSSNASKNDCEKPHPIKIAQLLGRSESLQNIQKDSVRKKIQPERLGTFSNIKNKRMNEKQNGNNTSVQFVSFNKCTRRNLNFDEISINSLEDINKKKNQSNKVESDKSTHRKLFNSVKRKSLLLPPNTIKDKHLQKCTNKISEQSKVSEVLKEVDEINIESTVESENKVITESLNNNINSTACSDSRQICNEQEVIQSSDHSKSKFVDINYPEHFKGLHITPKSLIISKCKSPEQVIIDSGNPLPIQINSLHQKCILNKNALKTDRSTKPKEADNSMQNLCNDLQHTKLVVSENDISMKHESPDMIYISKDKIIRLVCDLTDLLKETEKNIFKLRSILTCATRLLPINDKEITFLNAELSKEKNTMIDREVQVETCCKSIQYSEKQLKTPITHIPQIPTNLKFSNKNKPIQNYKNKENYENLNMSGMSDMAADESFLELENQLNAIHAKPIQDYPITQLKTPIIMKHKQKRSFREYMALKSSMSFLETPDGKKFRSLCQINNIDKSSSDIVCISNKLLTDLNNLYSDSPES